MITLEMITKEFYVLGLTTHLTRKLTRNKSVYIVKEMCTLRHALKKTVSEPVTCILYAEFPGHLEIDKSRNVTVE